jgi:hypothetical protein
MAMNHYRSGFVRTQSLQSGAEFMHWNMHGSGDGSDIALRSGAAVKEHNQFARVATAHVFTWRDFPVRVERVASRKSACIKR